MGLNTIIPWNSFFGNVSLRIFWSYRAPSVNKPGDDRAIAILKQLGLADRYQVIDDLPNQNFTKTIDYANTDALISKLRSDAFSYLDKIMNSI